ncbi:ribosome biogenesis protein ENP2 [Pancytospora epiphaga]|nr:ribosome biogenesis protein ENP2 [Pancytospora epiphaga]
MASEDIAFKEVDTIKNFEYPVACLGIRIAPNRKRIITIGTYKPSVRVFDLESLSMKFERHMVSDPVKVESLTDNAEKFVILRGDKCFEFHTRNGLHDLVYMPMQPKAMVFNKVACELYASGEYDSIYRFNLEQGRFLREIDVSGIVCMGFSMKHGFIGGVSKHYLHFIDSRSKNPILSRVFPKAELLSIGLSEDGLTYAIGEDNGTVGEYDIRSDVIVNKVVLNDPATRIVYNGKSIFCHSNSKIAVCEGGNVITTVNPGFTINDFDINGGLLSLGGEYEEMRCYVSDKYGAVPDWCIAPVL